MPLKVGPKKERQVPQNTKLWSMLVNLAKQKFQTYPSLPASRWIHQEYVKRGGTFVKSTKEDTRHKGGKETAQGKKERKEEEKK
jgi:hypothetical protein